MAANDSIATPSELERRARAERAAFYSLLEERVKRFPPSHFGPRIVSFMQRYRSCGHFAWAPPHWVAQAIEANCAHARGHARDELTENRYARIQHLFSDFTDSASTDLLNQDFGTWALGLYREQIELQREYSQLELSRYYRIFVKNNPMPGLAVEFKSQTGLTIEDWFRSSCAIFSKCLSTCAFQLKHPIVADRVLIDPSGVERYLTLAAATPAAIGQRFKGLREKTSPKFHRLIRSAFFQTPVIRYDEVNFLAPFPALVFHHIEHGLYPHLLPLPSFSREFGRAVQSYVELVLRCAKGLRCVVTDRELAPLARDKSCDFLVEFPSFTLLVEVKATSFTRDIVTPGTIGNDNSTHKIGDGMYQLYKTAHDLLSGRFSTLGVKQDAPVYGVVVTFGHVPFANAPWYFDSYLHTNIASKLSAPFYPAANMTHTPMIFSLVELELLISVINTTERTVPSIVSEKQQMGFDVVGDWDRYLVALAKDAIQGKAALPHVEADSDEFFASFGVTRHRAD